MVPDTKQPLSADECSKRMQNIAKALDKKLATTEYVDEQIAKIRREITNKQ